MRPLALLAALAGCGGGEGAEGTSRDFTVDCLGMALNPGALFPYAQTPYPTIREGESAPRCELMLSETLTTDTPTLRPVAHSPALGLDLAEPDWAVLWINQGGERWAAVSGELSLSTRTDGLVVGRYDVEAQPLTAEGGLGGQRARAQGELDACVYSAGADCPHEAADSELPRVTVDGPVLSGEGEAAVCRILLDEATGGLRVDMVLATWGGSNVADIWTPVCNLGFAASGVPTTSFVFHGAGVSGSGSYGPSAAATSAGVVVPGFTWSWPKTLLPLTDPTAACDAYYGAPAVATTGAGSACSFDLDEEDGGFSMSCSAVTEDGTGGVVSVFGEGDFSIALEGCSVVTR